MFNTVLDYKFIQRNRNKTGRESYLFEYIYKFFYHRGTGKRKYIVTIKEYSDKLFTVAFYAKVDNVDKYRITTNQRAFGRIGGTVLDIMATCITEYGVRAYGIEAAAMLYEESDENTKRYRTYVEMLRRKIKTFSVLGIIEKSLLYRTQFNNIEIIQAI